MIDRHLGATCSRRSRVARMTVMQAFTGLARGPNQGIDQCVNGRDWSLGAGP